MRTLMYLIFLFGISSAFAATTPANTPQPKAATDQPVAQSTTPPTATTDDEILHCPEDYDKIFMSFSISNSKSLGFSNIYYCVLKGVINTENGIRSIIKTIKTENKINGDVTPIYFQILKD